MNGPNTERGSVTLWVAVAAAGLLLMMSMVVDSGAKIRAGDEADTVAAEAARAAVIASGPRQAGSPGGAAEAARNYIAKAGLTGRVSITGPREVAVTVTATRKGPVSGHPYRMTRSARAQLLVGVETGERP